ncbi:aminopeptidase N isoform X2 [Anabrus simplex]
MVFVYLLSVLVTGMVVFQWLNPNPTVAATMLDSNTPEESSISSSSSPTSSRLPTHVMPTYYRLQLMPFLTAGNFTAHGDVWIQLNCSSSANNITLNIKDIDILESDVSVTHIDTGMEITIHNHIYDKESEMYSVVLHENLDAGATYQLHIRFVSHLNDLLQGFYRSSYVDQATGSVRWLASTQFSPTDARRAFPCFDEPAFKARFQISIARPSSLTSMSNMPQNKTEPVTDMPGWWWDHYLPTLPMSTYLVAFIVSDLQGRLAPGGSTRRKADDLKSNVNFRVWARRDALQQTQYAAQIGPHILQYLENYFGIKFPLPKQDMVALPDFGFNAMENWGLITYRETAMLYDENVSTLANKEQVASVIGHELAHQWFGNLVTPMWWNDLWLKEGFATYIGYQGVNHIEPSWREDQRFIQKTVQQVLRTDALESSHPISVPVNHPNQIRQIFDSISYSKGASIIRMMSHFLGEDTFRAGLKSYLQGHAYGNARQEDLWEALTTQAHQDDTLPSHLTVQMIMDTWTLQTGYPVIKVMRDYERKVAVITQERFLLYKSSNGTKSSPTWWIPLTYTTQDVPDFNKTRPNTWLEITDSTEIHEVPDEDNWMFFNIQETGFYRVNYDAHNWQLLTDGYSSLPDMARAQLLDDALNLAQAGQLNYSTALNLVHNLRKDMQYLPWSSAHPALIYLRNMLALSPIYGSFKAYMLQLINPLYNKLQFEERLADTHLERLHRRLILHWACGLGHEQCVWNARTKFRVWMSQDSRKVETNPISPNLRAVVYCTAIKHGGSDEWNFAWKKYSAANVGSERENLLDALGCSSQPWLLNRYLNWMLSNESIIRKQDGFRVFASVNNNVVGHSLAFNFLRNNWEDILDYFGLAFSSVSKMVSALPKYMNTQLQLHEMEAFKRENDGNLGTAAKSFEQTIEKVQANVDWMDNSYGQVEEWLKMHTSSSL